MCYSTESIKPTLERVVVDDVAAMCDLKAEAACLASQETSAACAPPAATLGSVDLAAMTKLGEDAACLASEAYLGLHESVSIGQSIASFQATILQGKATSCDLGVYLHSIRLTAGDGARCLALYMYGLMGYEMLDQAARNHAKRVKAVKK